MPRRGNVPKREVLPDPMYRSVLVTKLINSIMLDGKKGVAQKVVYGAFDIIKEKTDKEPMEVYTQALENIMPSLEVKARRVGGATYQVPMEVRPERRQTLGVVLVGNQGIREKIEGKSREQYRQVANRAWQRQQISTGDVQPEDIKMLFPVLEGREQELTLLYKVAQTAEGIRGAVRLFGNAFDSGDYDFNGIVRMAKMMHLDLKGAEKAVRA